MSAIARLPRLRVGAPAYSLELAWITLALANYAAGLVWQRWEDLPLRIGWIALVVAYGLLVLRESRLLRIVFALAAAAAVPMALDALHVISLWRNPFDLPPVMAAMCLAMVWDSRRHHETLNRVRQSAEERGSLLERQERFLHDASHELRTPLTIARGHLELLRGRSSSDTDLEIALDEMRRLDEILARLLVLAAADQPDFLQLQKIETVAFLEDVFVRWIDLAPRAWRLGEVPDGLILADRERLRTALDALLENAVKYTREDDAIELRAKLGAGDGLIIEVTDEGCGIDPAALPRIFDRFGRASLTAHPPVGFGLGLAIVDAIARGHGGRCRVATGARGSTFTLELPGFTPSATGGGLEMPELRSWEGAAQGGRR